MAILDFFKKPKMAEVQAEGPVKEEKPPTHEIGKMLSTLYQFRDFRRYSPDSLIANKGSGVYDKMLMDDQVKAVMAFKKAAVTARKWYFDTSKSDDEDFFKRADILYAIVEKIHGSWTDKLVEILSAMDYGFSISEKVYMPVECDGLTYWGIKDIKLRHFTGFLNGFKSDEHGNLEQIIQEVDAKELPIPMSKIIHFVHQPDKDRHYGQSDLMAAYTAWWSKDIAIKFQNIHLERHAGGFVWAAIDGTKAELSTAERQNLEDIISNLTAYTGIVVPDSITINSNNPMRTDAYDKAISRYDKAIAKSVLVPNLLGLSEQGDTGSYAQSQTQLDVFFWVLSDIANRLAETLNEQLFKPLALYNFGDDNFPPFTFEAMSDIQKDIIAKRWTEMVKGGVVQNTLEDENKIRGMLDFPQREEDEEDEMLPVEMPDEEEIEVWIDNQPNDEFIRKQFQDHPWLKRVNFTRIETNFDDQGESLVEKMAGIFERVGNSVILQVEKVGKDRSWGNVEPKEIEAVQIPKNLMSSLRKTLRAALIESLDDGYSMAKVELPKKMFRRIGPGMDKTKAERFISSKTMKVTQGLEMDVRNSIQQVLENSIRHDKTLKQTIAALREDAKISSLIPTKPELGTPWRLENIARTNISDAFNQGRMSLFGDKELAGFVKAYEYSAILDSRTTDICEHLHGKIRKDFGEYLPPNHYQCRSLLIPITEVDEWDGRESAKPRLEPQEGFK